MRVRAGISASVVAAIYLVAVPAAQAATHEVAGCEQVDVQAAIDGASDGDTVLVGEGQCTWSTSADNTPAVSIDGKSIELLGAGIGLTVITDQTGGLSNQHLLVLAGASGIRVAGFTFRGMPRTDSAEPAIVTGSDCVDFRIDHCEFDATGTGGRGIMAHGQGVIDHCSFVNTRQGIAVFGDGDASWAAELGLGSDQAVFVEDCSFEYADREDGALDAYGGAHYVFRYNAVLNTNLGHHGLDSGNYRSTRVHEIYGNTFDTDVGVWTFFRSRGGTGVVFDNQANGDYGGPLLVNYRTCCEVSHDNCSSWGRCDGDNPIDGNEDPTGYPCKDQIGRAQDLGDGSQLLAPVFAWNNAASGASVDIAVNDPWGCSDPAMADHIQEGRDFFNSERPDYEPYPYPHPLTLETCADMGGTCCGAGQICHVGSTDHTSDCVGTCCVGGTCRGVAAEQPAYSGDGGCGCVVVGRSRGRLAAGWCGLLLGLGVLWLRRRPTA